MDMHVYGELLAKYRPAIIETEEEHERMLAAAEEFAGRATLGPEERKILALMALLIELFENDADTGDDDEGDEPAELPQPHETLRRLLENRGLAESDIADIFGNPRAAADALAGKRPISRGQAKQLGKYFRVPDKLFLG